MDYVRSTRELKAYQLAFKQFLKDGAKTQDLRVLLEDKPKVWSIRHRRCRPVLVLLWILMIILVIFSEDI